MSASEKKKPDEGPAGEATVTLIGAATTQITLPGGVVVQVQRQPVLGTTTLLLSVPVPTDAADAAVKAEREAVERKYRAAANDLIAERVERLEKATAALEERQKKAAQARHTADQKAAEAKGLLTAFGNPKEIDKLQEQAAELTWLADRNDENVKVIAAEVKRLRAEADAALRAANGALIDAATGHDGKALAKASAALAAALGEVVPVALQVHAAKLAKVTIGAGGVDGYLEEALPGAPPRAASARAPRAFPADGPVRVRRVGPAEAGE